MATRRAFPEAAARRGRRSRLPSLRRRAAARVVVIGGGFGGATAARTLKALRAALAVTLVEPNPRLHGLPVQQRRDRRPARDRRSSSSATTASSAPASPSPQTARRPSMPRRKTVTLADGNGSAYDRLVLSPGIDFAGTPCPATTRRRPQKMPHAWKAGAQTAAAAPAARRRWTMAAWSSCPRRPIPSAARPGPTSAPA